MCRHEMSARRGMWQMAGNTSLFQFFMTSLCSILSSGWSAGPFGEYGRSMMYNHTRQLLNFLYCQSFHRKVGPKLGHNLGERDC